MKIVCENTIGKPPETVFPWIANPEKAMQWQKNVKGGEIIVDKPEKVGTTFKETIEEDGKSLEMFGTITNYIENEIIAFHLESKIHIVDVSYVLKEEDSSTRLTIDTTIKCKFPMNVMSLFMGKKMREGIKNQLESEIFELKKLCETE